MDCAQPAAHWSQIHSTDGTDPANYEPRCIPCRATTTVTRSFPARHHNAKLTEARGRGIYASVGATQCELAEIHGVHRTHIKDIRLGELWKRITGGRKVTW